MAQRESAISRARHLEEGQRLDEERISTMCAQHAATESQLQGTVTQITYQMQELTEQVHFVDLTSPSGLLCVCSMVSCSRNVRL